MGKFNKTELAVSELESIKNNVRELNKIVVMLTITIVILVIGGIIVVSNSVTIPDTESWPEAGPSAVFGVSQCPDADADAAVTADTADASCRICPTCPTCPACVCVHRSYTWVGRFMAAVDEEAQSPDEIRDIANLAYHESRYTPSAVSSAGAVGICQIKPDAWPDVDMALLVEDPDYAAVQCLRIYRIYRSKCGGKWYRCYRMGVAGARAADAVDRVNRDAEQQPVEYREVRRGR